MRRRKDEQFQKARGVKPNKQVSKTSPSPNKDKKSPKDKKAVKVIKSDSPTVAIAPADYEHLYSAGKDKAAAKPKVDTRGNPIGGGGVKAVKSDTPTVAIAPSDYVHMFAAGKVQDAAIKPKVDTRGRPIQDNVPPTRERSDRQFKAEQKSKARASRASRTSSKKPEPVKAMKSDTPTVAIAPPDYEHLYSAGKDKAAAKPKVDTRGNPIGGGGVKPIKSDTPTVAIAPADYEHLYSAGKDKAAAKPKVDTRGNPISGGGVKPIKSDTPTVAIAPSDYVHMYAAGQVQDAAIKPKVDTRGRPIPDIPPQGTGRRSRAPEQEAAPVRPVKSDTPTVAIAPSDYVHMYAAGKVQDNAIKPKVDTRGRPIPPEDKMPEGDEDPIPRRETSDRRVKDQVSGAPAPQVRQVKSDTPTVAIAPSDYAHLYAAGKETDQDAAPPKVDTRGRPRVQRSDEEPPPRQKNKSPPRRDTYDDQFDDTPPSRERSARKLPPDEEPPERERSARRIQQDDDRPPDEDAPPRPRGRARPNEEEAPPARAPDWRRTEQPAKPEEEINEDGISVGVIRMVKAFIELQPKKYYLKKKAAAELERRYSRVSRASRASRSSRSSRTDRRRPS